MSTNFHYCDKCGSPVKPDGRPVIDHSYIFRKVSGGIREFNNAHPEAAIKMQSSVIKRIMGQFLQVFRKPAQ